MHSSGNMSKSKPSKQPAGPTQRQRRVGEEVRALLSSVLMRGDLYVPDFKSEVITITEVRMSVDLRHAFAFVMTLGGENLEATLATLKQIAPLLRSHLAKSLRLRSAPMLHFEPDKSFEEVDKLERLFRLPQVAQDLEKK
jgi:ribosome-binding factor A